VKQLRNILSDRELYRMFWNYEDLKEICDIEEAKKLYYPTQLTMFRNRVESERLAVAINRLH